MSARLIAIDEPVTGKGTDTRLWCDVVAQSLVRYRGVLFTLVAMLYLLGFNGQWLIGPDSALYLSVGRNVAWGRGYTYQGSPHALAYPGLPFVLAQLFRLFGSHAIFAADVFILLCGFAVIALTYRLLSITFDRPTAVVVTLGLGITYEFYRYCFEILTDVPFAAGVMAVLAGHAAIFQTRSNQTGKKSPAKAHWYDWMLLFGGMLVAISMRPTMIGLLGAWLAAMIWSALRSGRSWRLLLGGAGLCLACLALFAWLDPRGTWGHDARPGYEQWAVTGLTKDLAHRLRYEMLDNVKDLFGASAARSVFGVQLGMWWMNAIFGTIILVSGVAMIAIQPLWGLWVAITIAMMVVFMSHDRYLVEILPLLVLAWWRVLQFVNKQLGPKWGNLAFAALLPLGILPNAAKCGAMVRWQQRRPFLSYYKDGRFGPYTEMAAEMNRIVTPNETVLAPQKMARIMTFLSDRRVQEQDEYYGGSSGQKLLILLDPLDSQMPQWLADLHVRVDGPQVASVARPGGKNPLPSLLLLRGRQE